MDKFKKILIAVHDASTSEKVAKAGYELSRQLGADIALISVAEDDFVISEEGITPDDLLSSQEEYLQQAHQLLMYKVFDNHDVATFIKRGDPYHAILDTANEWGADLIVMGTHGRTGLSHLLMGSVAEKTIRHSEIPVLIISTKT